MSWHQLYDKDAIYSLSYPVIQAQSGFYKIGPRRVCSSLYSQYQNETKNQRSQILALTFSMSSLLRILPETDLGTVLMNVTLLNLLKGETCCRRKTSLIPNPAEINQLRKLLLKWLTWSATNLRMSSSVKELLVDRTTYAIGTSPASASG